MPTSELPAFNRAPDPPDGWRFATTDDSPNKYAKIWSHANKCWMVSDGCIRKEFVYIVPIDPPPPPEPQYRPFANAAEFEPYRDKWWRYKTDAKSNRRPPDVYNDMGHGSSSWAAASKSKEFADGTPFGVRIDQ